MDDVNKELSNEEILKQMKEHLDEASKKYTFSLDRKLDDEINEYIENLKKQDSMECRLRISRFT